MLNCRSSLIGWFVLSGNQRWAGGPTRESRRCPYLQGAARGSGSRRNRRGAPLAGHGRRTEKTRPDDGRWPHNRRSFRVLNVIFFIFAVCAAVGVLRVLLRVLLCVFLRVLLWVFMRVSLSVLLRVVAAVCVAARVCCVRGTQRRNAAIRTYSLVARVCLVLRRVDGRLTLDVLLRIIASDDATGQGQPCLDSIAVGRIHHQGLLQSKLRYRYMLQAALQTLF